MRLSARFLSALVIAATACVAAAGERDLHAYWDGRCKDCHGDAGAFARRTLRVEDGRLAGTHHRGAALEQFLRNHYLADDLVAPVMQMLQAQAGTTPVFKAKCSACHGSASEFARQALTVKDGQLIGRSSQRPVQDYLRRHGGLAPEQVAPMTQTLERVLREVGGPP